MTHVGDSPSEVALLTELMRAYRAVGDAERCQAVMRMLRDIPSKADLKEEARALVKTAAAWQDGESVDVDGLRSGFADVFHLVESRQTIRPADVMAATGCGCSFAIDVLLVFVRLGIVLQDRDMGLRDVAASKPTGMVSVRPARSPEEIRMGRCAEMKRELDAFRKLTELEPKLAEWPRAVPLLERALALYETTHQTHKRDEMLKRLAEVTHSASRLR